MFRWEIIGGNESGIKKPRTLVHPWQSSYGYEVMGDGWILSPTKKQLVWLSHEWRSLKWNRTWCQQFLGLRDRRLPEVVIPEFFD